MTPQNTFSHPITGETLYSREAFDAITTQYVERQCVTLTKNLKEKKSTSIR